MMPAVVEHCSDTDQWLTHLFAGCEGWLTLFSLDRTDGTQHTDWAPVAQHATPAAIADQPPPASCVWCGAATRRQRRDGKRRGGADDCLHLPALWGDVDVAGPNHTGGHTLPPNITAGAKLINSFPV